jgi:hypothetical protein
VSDTPVIRWWGRLAASPRGVFLFGWLVALLTVVVLALRFVSPHPSEGKLGPVEDVFHVFALICSVVFFQLPGAFCAAGLRIARQHPLLPWVKGQVRIVLAFGFVVILADMTALAAIALAEEDIRYGVFFLYMTCGQLVLVGSCFLGLRILVYLLRWHWGERPDGWRDSEEVQG